MFSFLAKRIFHRRHQPVLPTPVLRRSLSTQPQQQPKEKEKEKEKELPFIAHYLSSSFGFSPHRALKYSAHPNLTAIKSSERPESVVTFLKDTGLSDDQIKAAVSFYPILLASNVETTLKPKVRELMDAGFSGELLAQLIRYNPAALNLKDTLSRVLFWRDFFGNNDKVLLKIIRGHVLLITYDIDKHVVPKINLFKEYGLSNRDIVSLLETNSYCFRQNVDSSRQILELIEELGIKRGSRMFLVGIKAIGGFRKDKIKRNAEFFMVTYGWSEEDVSAAFRKVPMVLGYSTDKVKSNMDFLIRKAGFESRNIALHPQLVGYSVERGLNPRYTVLSALEAKGRKKCSLSTACRMSKSKFLERYVVPYEKDVPGLGEAYAAAYGGKVPV